MTHCCGHNAQSAALLGIAAALKQPHALDGLCGSIRLVVVPAEEMIQLAFREELRQKGIIKYNGGKTEFMYRGLLDGVDMAMMVHGMTKGSGVNEDGDTDLDFQALLGMYSEKYPLQRKICPCRRSSSYGSQRGVCRYAGSPGMQRPP